MIQWKKLIKDEKEFDEDDEGHTFLDVRRECGGSDELLHIFNRRIENNQHCSVWCK